MLSSLLFLRLDHDAGEEVSGRRVEAVVSNVSAEPAAVD